MAHILIVEDNLMDGRNLAEATREAGHDVRHVYTLSEGKGELADGSWDLVLLDMTLPDGEGREAAAELAREGHRVVLLLPETGYEDAACDARSMRKPLQKEELIGAVEAALKEPKPVKPAARKAAKKKTPAAGKAAAKKAPAKSSKKAAKTSVDTTMPAELPSLKEFRAIMERRYLEALMESADGDAPTAIATAGVSRAGYYNLLKKHGLTEKS